MIHIGNIRDPNPSVPGFTDGVLAIVRSNRNIPSYALHVPDLSPSWNLFNKYRAWKDCGHWNAETFATQYVPQFLAELCQSEQAIESLNSIKALDAEGKDLWLVCFCYDETLCHRSIIAGVLQGMGVQVDSADYSRYYEQLKRAFDEQRRKHDNSRTFL